MAADCVSTSTQRGIGGFERHHGTLSPPSSPIEFFDIRIIPPSIPRVTALGHCGLLGLSLLLIQTQLVHSLSPRGGCRKRIDGAGTCCYSRALTLLIDRAACNVYLDRCIMRRTQVLGWHSGPPSCSAESSYGQSRGPALPYGA